MEHAQQLFGEFFGAEWGPALFLVTKNMLLIVAIVLPLDACRRLSYLCGTQDHRLHAVADRPQPGDLLWHPMAGRLGAADRRCGQGGDEGNHHPQRGEQVPVRAGAGAYICARAGGVGSRAVFSGGGAGGYQCRSALHPGDDFDGRLRRDHRRLGIQFQICVSRRDAFGCADRVV